MKANLKNICRMDRTLLPILMALLSVSCAKRELAAIETELGTIYVAEEGGAYPVLVDTEGAWYAVSESSWIDVDESLHRGRTAFVLNCRNNLSYQGCCRLCREGRVKVLTCDGATETVLTIRQKGRSPSFDFPESVVLSPEGGECRIACATDLPDEGRAGLSFSSDASWLKAFRWGDDGRSLVFDAEAGSGRNAIISLIHTDVWGRTTSASVKVTQ